MMIDSFNDRDPSQSFSWQRPSLKVLSLLIVLVPLPITFVVAHWTSQDGVALLGVPLCLLLAWWMLRLRGERWHDVGVRRVESPWRLAIVVVVATIVLLIATPMLSAFLAAATGWTPDIHRFDPVRGNIAVLAAGLMLVWTTAAFGEELVMRGFVMHTLEQLFRQGAGSRWSWLAALVLSSLIFGVAHAYQGLAGILLTSAIGFGFGLAFYVGRRNLWHSILTHGAYDTVGFVIVYLNWDRLVLPATLSMAA